MQPKYVCTVNTGICNYVFPVLSFPSSPTWNTTRPVANVGLHEVSHHQGMFRVTDTERFSLIHPIYNAGKAREATRVFAKIS